MDTRTPEQMKFTGNVAENFRKFKQNFEIYLKASGKISKPDDVKVAILLNIIGEEGVEIYNTLKLSEDQKHMYDVVIKEFESYTNPKRNVIYERYLFFTRKQMECENFDHYVTDLKKLASSCEFGEQKESLIRDRIVLGINDLNLQERLLRKDDLDLYKAVNECRAAEVANAQVRAVQEKQVSELRKMKKEEEQMRMRNSTTKHASSSTSSSNMFLCYRCKEHHGPRQCRAYGQKCAKCGMFNHFAKACRAKNVTEVSVGTEADTDLTIGSISVSNVKIVNTVVRAWYKTLNVEYVNVNFKLDTGSEVNILPASVYYKHYSNNYQLKPTGEILEAYGGYQIRPLGYVMLPCSVENVSKSTKFIVADVESKPILGLNSCIDLKLLQKVNSVTSQDPKEIFINENEEVFTGVGKFKYKYSIKLKQNYEAVAKPARRIPFALQERLKEKLLELEKMKLLLKLIDQVSGSVIW